MGSRFQKLLALKGLWKDHSQIFFLDYLEYHIYFHKRLKQVAAHFRGSRSVSVPFIF